MSKVVLLIKLVNVFTKNFLFLGDRPNSNSNVILARDTLLRKNVLINGTFLARKTKRKPSYLTFERRSNMSIASSFVAILIFMQEY